MNMSRLITLFAALLVSISSWAGNDGLPPLRIGLTAVVLGDQAAFLRQLDRYLEEKLQRPVEFHQRRTYREITEMIATAEVDVAWVCGFPYVRNKENMRLLAVPIFRGAPLYQSYFIVPKDDLQTQSIAELENKIFAYSDPDSNSGYLLPRYHLLQLGKKPSSHFKKSFFTWSHRDVVRAVAERVADGGSVDGYIWEVLANLEPGLTAKTRIVTRSKQYGFPPLVARISLPQEEFQAIQSVLTHIDEDDEGRLLLKQLGLDGFINGDPSLFNGIEDITRFVDRNNAQ